MFGVLDKDSMEVSAPEHEHRVEALTSEVAHNATTESVGPMYRDGPDDPRTLGDEDDDEDGEIRVAMADEEIDRIGLFEEFHRHHAGLLGHPGSDWSRNHASAADETSVDADQHNPIQAVEQNGIDDKEVADQ